jgi:LmbE family N-acetylglucosaminyl deacetylase
MKILAIAPHPDDETLGCGGTLLKSAAEGAEIHWLLMTAAHEPQFTPAQISQQLRQIEAARQAYPFASLTWLKFPATRLDQVPRGDMVNQVREVVARLRPDTVYVPHRGDIHTDHRDVFLATQAVLKTFYLRAQGVRRVLAYEVPSETDAMVPAAENAFLPTVFVDISATFERKLEIMRMFAAEVHPEPLPRSPSSIRALARHRGATIGVEYAEAFALVRELS